MEEFKGANQWSSDTNIIKRWKNLIEWFIKVNLDTAIDEGDKKMGIGTIVRDSEREILASLFVKKQFNSKPVLAECIALCRVMV